MGQIAGLAQESSGESQTQFQKEVAIFIKYISILAITIGALVGERGVRGTAPWVVDHTGSAPAPACAALICSEG